VKSMKRKLANLLSLSLGVVIVAVPFFAAVPMFAHHSTAAFDNEKSLTIQGTVTQWYWANPHCLLKLDVKTESGEVVHWVTETGAPANMVDAGWRKNSLKPGDQITVTLRPAKSGKPVGRTLRVEFADGKTLEVGAVEDTANKFHLSGAPTK
jgi:Family of unknown function (DUF6152)